MNKYDDFGKGEPIVFIHGLGCTKNAWAPQYELMDEYRLIVPDLRGHGESPITENITLHSFAQDIISLLDKLAIKNAHICGLSLGGLVAQEIYRMAPDKVKTLILANTFSYALPFFSAASLWMRSWNLQVMGHEEYLKHTISTCLFDRNNQDLRKKVHSAFLIRYDTYMKSARAGAYADFRELLPEIKVPVLLIGSAHDQVTPPAAQRWMYNRITNAEMEILQRTGHLSNIESAEEFNQNVRLFLKRTSSRFEERVLN